MNEQFIILAEKLNQISSVAETLTPEVIKQTLEFNFTVLLSWFILTFLVGTILSVYTYKLYKENIDEWLLLLISLILFYLISLEKLTSLIHLVFYPYSWVYSHFVG